MSRWYLCFPRGDRGTIATAEVSEYELDHYTFASVKSFATCREANAYGRELAQKHGLNFEPDTDSQDPFVCALDAEHQEQECE